MVFPYTAGAQSGVMAHAMAFSKPVVTSKLKAFDELVKSIDNGISCESDDEYIEAIVKLLTDRDYYDQCVINTKKHVKESISWDLISQLTEKIYQQFGSTYSCKSKYIYFG